MKRRVPGWSVLLLLIAPATATALDHHVYPGQSIQDALDGAGPGDIIFVHEGTYIQDIVFDGRHTDVTISASGNESVTLIGEGASYTVEVASCTGIRISGLTIAPVVPDVDAVISIDESPGTQIDDCTIIGSAGSQAGGSGSPYSLFRATGDVTGLIVHGCSFSGFYDNSAAISFTGIVSSGPVTFAGNSVDCSQAGSEIPLTRPAVEWMSVNQADEAPLDPGARFDFERNHIHGIGAASDMGAFLILDTDNLFFRSNVIGIEPGYNPFTYSVLVVDGGDGTFGARYLYVANNTWDLATSAKLLNFGSVSHESVAVTNNLIAGTPDVLVDALDGTYSDCTIQHNHVTGLMSTWQEGSPTGWDLGNNVDDQPVVWQDGATTRPVPYYDLTEDLDGGMFPWDPGEDFLLRQRNVPPDVGAFERVGDSPATCAELGGAACCQPPTTCPGANMGPATDCPGVCCSDPCSTGDPVVSFSTGDIWSTEGEAVDIMVQLDQPGTATVLLEITGSAVDAPGEIYDDFNYSPATLDFQGDANRNILLTPLTDGFYEPGMEQVILTLLPGPGYSVSPGSGSVVVYIEGWDPPPAGWDGMDIGDTGLGGGSMQEGEVINLVGAGMDIGGSRDACHFLHRGQVGGDFDLVAQLLYLTPHSENEGKAGLMVRSDSSPGAVSLSLVVDGNGDASWQARQSHDGGTEGNEIPTGSPTPFLKIARRGSTISVFTSDSGEPGTWSEESPSWEPSLPASLYVGLFVTSQDTGRLSAARYSGVSLDTMSGDVQITTAGLPDATEEIPYETYLQAVGGTEPYSWSMEGDLPEGLEVHVSGRVSGTPDAGFAGPYTLTMTVLDALGETDSRELSLMVHERDPGCSGGMIQCDTGCVDPSTDPSNCGACGNVCDLPHATETCRNSTCYVESCDTGRVDCNLLPEDGCEVELPASARCVEGGVTYEEIGCGAHAGPARDGVGFLLVVAAWLLLARRRRP